MRTLIALFLLAIIEPGGLEKPESPCKWYVNKLTPGPIGTNVKLIGSRKTLEYIQLQSDCEKPVYSHLMVLIVQSVVPVGLSKAYPTPMPTIIAHYNFGGLRTVDVKSNGKRHTILIGRQHVGKGIIKFSLPGYSTRSKCSTCIFKDQLTAGSILWDSKEWQNYDPKRVFYSIHVMDRRWVVYDGHEEYNADKIKYAEFESCRKTEIRRIDSFLAEIIRQKQMDAVIFAPKFVEWDINKPFSRMFVSEYSMAMFQALEDDGFNRRPRVVWYDPNEEKPLVLCSKTDDTTTSYGFQQITAEPTDDNEKVCGNEWLDLTDLVPSPKLLFKGQSSSEKENNEKEDIRMFVDIEETCEGFDSNPEPSYDVIRMRNTYEENKCHEDFSVMSDVCDNGIKEQYSSINPPTPSYQGAFEPSTTNKVIISQENVDRLRNGNDMSDFLIDALMRLIIFDKRTPNNGYYQECDEAYYRVVRGHIDEQCSKVWANEIDNLVFPLSTVNLVPNRAPHFSCVHCNRKTLVCSIYDSIPSYRTIYSDQIKQQISTAVQYWDCGGSKWSTVVVNDKEVKKQDDGQSCALFAVYHMGKALDFNLLEENQEATGRNLRLATLKFIKAKHEAGLVEIETKDGSVYIFSTDTVSEPIEPQRLEFRNVYPSIHRLGVLDSPNEKDVEVESHRRSDETGVPLKRKTTTEQALLRQATLDSYCKKPKLTESNELYTDLKGTELYTDIETLQQYLKDMNIPGLKVDVKETHAMVQKLLNYAITSDGKDEEATKIAFHEAAEESRRQGLTKSLIQVEKEFGFKTRPKSLLQHSEWLDLHVGNSLETSYFYCRLCSKGDFTVRNGLPTLEEVIIPRYKRNSKRVPQCSTKLLEFDLSDPEKLSRDKRLVGNVETRVYLSDYVSVNQFGFVQKKKLEWKAFLFHASTHETSNKHISKLALKEIDIKDQTRRDAISKSQFEVTCTHFRTVIYMTKYNIPLFHFTNILKMQMLNGVNIGINMYTPKAGTRVLFSVAEKLRINLLTAMYKSDKPFSMLADSSTSKDAHQYMVVSLKCTLDSLHYHTFFYTVIELKRETSKAIYTSIEKQVKEDSNLLYLKGYMQKDVFEKWFWRRLIGFASDGGSVFAGDNQGLQGRLTAKQSEANQPFFYSICMAHRIDLVFKNVDSPFRSFMTFMYSVTYRYFGSTQNKLLVERYRNYAIASGLTPPSIKTIFKVRWVASELSALNNLLRGWKSILGYLQFRRFNVPVTDKKDIQRARMLEILRFVMEDTRVFRAALTWKLILEKIDKVSKQAQREGASIASIWPLLHILEHDLKRNSEWRETEIKLLSHYGLMYSSSGVYKPFDKHISFFGSAAFPMLARFEAEKSEEVKPKLSDESRIDALRFAQHADELKNDNGLNGKSSTDQLKDTQYTPLRSSAEYEDELKKLLDYVTDDTEVMPSLSKAKKTSTTPDPNAATTGSARLRALKFPDLKTAVEALDDSENPEKIDAKVKVPSFLSYYASIEWESFSLDQLVTDAKETVHKRKVDDEEEKFDYLQFEALNDRFITDVMSQGSKNIYIHNKWDPRFVSDNWFGNDANKRKNAVMDSIESLKSTFQLGPNFISQYESFIDNLVDCLTPRQQQLVLKRQHMLWSTILNTPKCVPSLHSDLRDAIFAMLALPGSTAQVERAFSIVFHTRGPRRTRMNVETLNAILSVRLNVGRVENMDVPEFVRYWSTDNSMLAHSNSLYESSELFNFKQKLVNDVSTTDAQEMEESEDIFDIYDEWVPRLEHMKETSAQQELNLVSDRYIAGEKQTRSNNN
ncbi:hypothetical protein CAEBREN_16807 [Caenorhabditis brenneri]|uniref:Uncharacterized protein n=1 Tax=Caenorhabditis brenneri TaxID=135651 RepID=G0MQE3_CAEBE|nr:hypothetical protein CAEBREN_16807 [Caenorhabditis brenneri]